MKTRQANNRGSVLTDAHYKTMPHRVKIGPYMFDIEIEDIMDAAAAEQFGHCNTNNQMIRIQPSLKPQKLVNTFLHECIHGMHWLMGLMSPRQNQSWYDTEEDFTHLGANAMCMFLKDNPHVVKWMMKWLVAE